MPTDAGTRPALGRLASAPAERVSDRRRLAAAAAGAVAFVLALAVPAGGEAGVHADGDGDKVYDDLEQTLAAKDGADEVDVIVTLHDPATAARVADLSRAVGGFAAGRRFTLVDGFAARMSKQEVRALAREGEVASIERDLPIRAANGRAQQAFGVTNVRLETGLDGDLVGGPDTYLPGDLVAAVLDTGIHAAHLDLDDGKVLAFASCLGGRCTTAAPTDPNGHGTHVAATLAGDGEARADRAHQGVAPGAALVGVRVLDANGGGVVSDLVTALEWVVANRTTYGIEVVNASIASDGCADGTDAGSRAVDAAVSAGLVVVLAAGNSGPETCTIGSPAAAAGALTVGAMSDPERGGFAVAPFSSRGPTLDGRAKPDLLAPGVGITSASASSATGYARSSGTSAAAPFVAGVALLMLEAGPALSPADVKSRIMATAVDWARPGADAETGAGRLDAYAALAAAGAPLGTAPPTPAHLARAGSVAAPGLSAELPLTIGTGAFPLSVTTTAATWSSLTGVPDFDLALVGPTGVVLASASTPAASDWPSLRRQESLSVSGLASGRYVLRITAAQGAGSFVLDVSGDAAPGPWATAAPTVGGTTVVGSTLFASPGSWEAVGSYGLAYQWRRCDAGGVSCTEVPGATSPTYALSAADVGTRLRVAVTASDGAGAATAVSTATASVAAPPVVTPPDTIAPAVRALASSGRRNRSAKLLYRVSDASGRTWERVRVYRGTRVIRTIRTSLAPRTAGRTYHVLWRAGRRAERLRFCVEAWDAGGLKSARSCAPLRIR